MIKSAAMWKADLALFATNQKVFQFKQQSKSFDWDSCYIVASGVQSTML